MSRTNEINARAGGAGQCRRQESCIVNVSVFSCPGRLNGWRSLITFWVRCERYESPLGSCREHIPLHLRIDGEFNTLPPLPEYDVTFDRYNNSRFIRRLPPQGRWPPVTRVDLDTFRRLTKLKTGHWEDPEFNEVVRPERWEESVVATGASGNFGLKVVRNLEVQSWLGVRHASRCAAQYLVDSRFRAKQ